MKVRLREIEYEDLELLKKWRNLPEVRCRVREYRLLNMENQRDWFERMSRNRNVARFIIEINIDGHWDMVGACGLVYIDWVGRKAEVSIHIGNENYWRKGIGTQVLRLLEDKAFDEFNLNKLHAEIFSNNYHSTALFEKCGYKIEGTLRDHAFKGGQYRDSIMYARFKGDRNV